MLTDDIIFINGCIDNGASVTISKSLSIFGGVTATLSDKESGLSASGTMVSDALHNLVNCIKQTDRDLVAKHLTNIGWVRESTDGTCWSKRLAAVYTRSVFCRMQVSTSGCNIKCTDDVGGILADIDDSTCEKALKRLQDLLLDRDSRIWKWMYKKEVEHA